MTHAVRSGVLVVDKPAGATSFDMVARLRRRLGVRRIGHAGTLDPEALGVLPLLVGEATKLVAYLIDESKEYVATIRLGVTTDSHDLTGRVLATATVPPLTRQDVVAATRAFVGRIRQTPPMYSAVHHEGRRLYELAREGIEVAREPREAIVHEIDVEDVGEATIRLRVVCGRGTYIRTLAADLGAALGCGAAIERLVRPRVGPFALAGATTATELAELPATALWARVKPPEAVLQHWRAAVLGPAAATAFVHGQPVATESVPAGTLVRVHDESGRMLGVAEVSSDGRGVRPVRILHADRPGTPVLSV